jgi:hypothetical protein
MTPYEGWGEVELDPRLRRAVLWSGITTVVTLLALLNLPMIWQWSNAEFFILLQPQLQAVVRWCWLMQRSLVWFNLASVGVYVTLLVITHQFQRGRLWMLRIAYGQSLIGMLNGLILSLALAVIVVNLVAWIVAAIVCLLLFFSFLTSAGR